MKLSALQLPSLPAGDYPDSTYPGLSFRVGKKKRVWSLRYRHGEKQKRETLGAYPKMGLKDARWAAEAFLDRIRAGAPATPAAKQESGETLGDLIDAFERMRKAEGSRIKTLEKATQTVRRGLADYLRLPASSFTKADLRAARDAIGEGHSHMGNRFLGSVGPILKWAVAEGRGIETNFARDLRRAPEKARDRSLSHAEIEAVFAALEGFADGRRQAARSFPPPNPLPPAHGLPLGRSAGLAAWRYPRRHLAPARQQGRPSASRLSLATGAGGNRQRAGARALLPRPIRRADCPNHQAVARSASRLGHVRLAGPRSAPHLRGGLSGFGRRAQRHRGYAQS